MILTSKLLLLIGWISVRQFPTEIAATNHTQSRCNTYLKTIHENEIRLKQFN